MRPQATYHRPHNTAERIIIVLGTITTILMTTGAIAILMGY